MWKDWRGCSDFHCMCVFHFVITAAFKWQWRPLCQVTPVFSLYSLCFPLTSQSTCLCEVVVPLKSYCVLHGYWGSLSTSVCEDEFVNKSVWRRVPLPPSSLALNSCRKVSAIVQTCGGAERLPVSHLSVSVVSPVSHTLYLFTGPERGTIEVCLVTHHISYGVWSRVEGGGEAASVGPSGLAN